ncbi:Cytosolic Fe-S cluster assembly factor nar1 [Tulasnella sp. 331]|nr:Cytosolic Fe-S cluster assembly factor nar1 [Tulasnella sp. 331]KAG8890396.1 Cytosolic Fe-S cluster assembly factor nar1 [Tulasnella sp. 332]
MTFSGALTLTDLNDFITPSQACIKPVEQVLAPEPKVRLAGVASTEIQIDSSGAYHEVSGSTSGSNSTNPTAAGSALSTTKKLQKAEISLNDCLACSGCITSAETVLITMQSHVEVLNVLSDNPSKSSPAHRLPILSIAPQSLASLSASLCSSSPVSLQRILYRVRAFATQELGFHRVYDTTFARHLTLLEHQREFLERRALTGVTGTGAKQLPMLSSACPGWVCYAEKAHPEMIPFISRTKSPQQVMGTLVKMWLGGKWEKTPDQIYHVTVMPCYDKKLEASRKDFYSEVYSTRDVDCVLTTGELRTMMEEKGWDLSKPIPGEDNVDFESVPPAVDSLPELLQHPGSSSGSYLHSLLDSLTLSNSHKPLLLSSKIIRSADYEEFILKDTGTGEIVFKGAKCYGFRNLQNVVRKVGKEAGVSTAKGAAGVAPSVALRGRRAKAAAVSVEDSKGYDYVEVMACPSGCVNGGGQIRPPPSSAAQKTRLHVDEEGFARDWSEEGVVSSTPAPIANQWGDKAWTSQVESIYWRQVDGSLPPTPPATPPSPSVVPGSSAICVLPSQILGKPDMGPSAAPDAVPAVTKSPYQSEALVLTQLAAARQIEADHLALRILIDLCYSISGAGAIDGSDPRPITWMDTVPGDGEARRRELFQTQYHAVESSDVIGLTVQW